MPAIGILISASAINIINPTAYGKTSISPTLNPLIIWPTAL